jgi:hypothetical protein
MARNNTPTDFAEFHFCALGCIGTLLLGFSYPTTAAGTWPGIGGLRALAVLFDEAFEVRILGALQSQLFTPGARYHGESNSG